MPARVVVRDRGYNALMKRLRGSNAKAELTVGIHEDKGSQSHGSSTVAEVAAAHEFGTKDIPERSIVSGWTDENEAQIREDIRKAGRELIRGKEPNMGAALDDVGKRAAQSMKARVEAGLSPAEQDGEGDPRPVIETGRVLESIDYKVQR